MTCTVYLTLCFAVVCACYLVCGHNQQKRSEMAVAGGYYAQAAMTKTVNKMHIMTYIERSSSLYI